MKEPYVIYSKQQKMYVVEGKTSTQSFGTFIELLRMYPKADKLTINIVEYY